VVGSGPIEFSFNSIRLMPEAMKLAPEPELAPHIERLSLMNTDLTVFDVSIRKLIMDKFKWRHAEKQSEGKIRETIEKMRDWLGLECSREATEEKTVNGVVSTRDFEQAVANYRKYRFFSRLDWRLAHWGTVEDVHSVVKETFSLPTSFIEFRTRWSPPVPAIQFLADAFPSVRFELFYHYNEKEAWKKVTFFPTVPFGY
jgi:hypothetical protein